MAGGFGAFGKMPSVGDFFRLNTPAGFVSVWDDWVQRAMLVGRSTLGQVWDDHYMSAPIWRFNLSAGLAGSQGCIGVIMPSVDRVGRRFPLTLVAATQGAAALDHFRAAAVFDRLEALALDALEDDMTREKLELGLAEIRPLPAQAATPIRRAGPCLAMRRVDEGGILPDLAAEYLDRGWARPSLWSADVAGAERLMVCDGLPEGPEVQGLFHLDAPIWSEGPAA